MKLENKVAVVTGGGTGIGKAICLSLASEGARVVVTDINLEWAQQAAEEASERGGYAIAMALDVTKKAMIEAVLTRIVDQEKRIDIWCNNAGVSTMKRLLDLTETDWDFNMNINAKGVFLCTQVAARQFINQEPDTRSGLRGKIINTASMAGKRGNAPFLAHYVASKFAVVGLTQATAGELAPYNITVNAVCPGYVNTDMQVREAQWEAELRGVSINDVKQFYVSDTPLQRLETPQDVAGVVLFLACPEADFITGEAINVNGGSFMD